jgi:hypothetical protein
MSKYHHQKNTYKKAKRWKKLYFSLVLFIALAIASLSYLGYGLWKDASVDIQPQQSSTDAGRYEGPLRKTISNDIFEFESSREWMFSRHSSQVGRKYEFISQRNTLTDYLLTIYINDTPANQAASYVVPVSVKDNALEVDKPLARCNEDEEDEIKRVQGSPNSMREMEGITFLCNRETSQHTAMAGVKGGGTSVMLKNGAGQDVRLVFVFEDVSGNFRPDAFTEILRTFKLK